MDIDERATLDSLDEIDIDFPDPDRFLIGFYAYKGVQVSHMITFQQTQSCLKKKTMKVRIEE